MGRAYTSLEDARGAFPMPSGYPADTPFPGFPSGTWEFADGDTWDQNANGNGRWDPFGGWGYDDPLPAWPTSWPEANTDHVLSFGASSGSLTQDLCVVKCGARILGGTPANMLYHLLKVENLTPGATQTIKANPDDAFTDAVYFPVTEYTTGEYGLADQVVYLPNDVGYGPATVRVTLVSISPEIYAENGSISIQNAGDLLQWEDGTVKFREDGGRALLET